MEPCRRIGKRVPRNWRFKANVQRLYALRQIAKTVCQVSPSADPSIFRCPTSRPDPDKSASENSADGRRSTKKGLLSRPSPPEEEREKIFDTLQASCPDV